LEARRSRTVDGCFDQSEYGTLEHSCSKNFHPPSVALRGTARSAAEKVKGRRLAMPVARG
jgi:hypothetical protein